MANEPAHVLAKHLRTLTTAARIDALTDHELIERFAAVRDEEAFTALVRRHGPMVLRVCRRILHNGHDADDVFQATFLVLSRKAASLRRRDSVGCFLHGVAYRLALKARTQFAQRRMHESRAAVEKQADDPLAELSVREAQSILDEELALLPEKWRAPVVLCCLEGRTRDEAARQLGWPAKLVKSRLEQGRERLRSRLCRRGLTLPAALGATLLMEEAALAAMPTMLIRAAVQATRTSDGVSASVALLAESALGSTAIGKAKIVVVALMLLTGALAAGMGALVPPKPLEDQAESPALAKSQRSEKSPTARTDRYGDPLPPQALRRLGTLRFRPGVDVCHLSFSPDGKLLATATHNWQSDSISLWDRATGKCLRRIDVGKNSPFTLVFTPDSKILAAQDHQGEIHLWEVESGKELRRFKGHVGFLGNYMGRIVLSVGFIFTPDGKALVARGPDKAIHLWELATGKDLRKLQADPEDLSPLAFSRDGKMLTTYNEKLIRLWDMESGKEKTRLEGHEASVGSPVFSPDGKTLSVLARTPGELRQVTAYVWDIASAKLLRKWNLIYQANAYCLSPDGATALAGGHYGDVRLFDLAKGKEIRRLSSPSWPLNAAAFSPDGKTIAAAGSNGAILFWDAWSGLPEAAFVGHQAGIESLALSPDGKFLASVAAEDGIMLWDLATARPLPDFHSPNGYFSNVAISPDGQWLAAGIQFRRDVRLLRTLTGEEVRRFTGCANGENVLAFSPDGKILAAGSTDNNDRQRDKSIRLWEAATGKLLRRIVFPLPARPTGGIFSLAFSPDGRLLASGCAGGDVHIWNAANGELYCRLPNHEFWVSSLCFSPDGQTLATTGSERAKKVVRLWEVRSGKERGQLAVPTDRGGSLAFSPDGRLASAGEDKTIRIWDLDTGEESGCFRGHESGVGPLAFSSDGQRLISGSRDTTILVWDMKTIAQPRRTQAAELSPKELEARWADLADADASKAFAAIRTLIRTRQQSVSFLKERLLPIPPIAAEKTAALIADLDSERFETRAKAEEELKKLRELAEPSLRQAVQDKRTSLEQRRHIERLLQRLQGPITSGETLRQLRAVEVLEHIGSPEARQVLQTLAEGAPEARLTREAKTALARLTHSSKTAR